MRLVGLERQRLRTEFVDFLCIVERFQSREVDALKNGFQCLAAVAARVLSFQNRFDALLKFFFGVVVWFEVHDLLVLFLLPGTSAMYSVIEVLPSGQLSPILLFLC